MSSNLTLAAVPASAPAGRTLEMLITVTNSGAVGVTCSKLKFAVPVGDGQDDLAAGGEVGAITARAATAGWSVSRAASAPATFYVQPDAGSADLAPYAQVGVTWSIPLNARPGTAPITVTSYQPSSAPATQNVRITKTVAARPDAPRAGAAAQAPVIHSFTTTPATAVTAGQQVTLSWSTAYAASAVIKSTVSPAYDIPSADVAKGSTYVYPKKPVTYTLYAYSSGYQPATFPQPIDVTPVSFESYPSPACPQGGSTYLLWKMAGASDIKVNGVSVKGQYSEDFGFWRLPVSPTYMGPYDVQYSVTAYGYVPNNGAYPNSTAFVQINPVSLAMTGYTSNQKYYIRFNSARSVNTARLFIYPYNGKYSAPKYAELRQKDVSGLAPFSYPYISGGTGATFYLKAYGPYAYGGSVLSLPSNGSSGTVDSTQLYFRPSARSINAGGSVTLRWLVPQAHYAKIYPNIGRLTGTKVTTASNGYSFKGSQEVSPSETTVYTLTVATAWGNQGRYNPQTYIQKVVVLPPGVTASHGGDATPSPRPASPPEESRS